MLCKHSAFPCGEARCRWSRRCCANTVRFYAAKRGLAAEEDAVQAQDVSVRRRTLSLVERTLCKNSPFCVRKGGLAVEEDAVRTQYVFVRRRAGLRRKKMLCKHRMFLCGEARCGWLRGCCVNTGCLARGSVARGRRSCANTVRLCGTKRGLAVEEETVRCRWSRRCCANTVRFCAAKRRLAAEEDAVQALMVQRSRDLKIQPENNGGFGSQVLTLSARSQV